MIHIVCGTVYKTVEILILGQIDYFTAAISSNASHVRKVAVVDEEDVTRELHGETADRMQAERLESNELDLIEKQLESMGEGSPPLLALDTEVELMEERSPAAPTLDGKRYIS